MSDGGRVRTGRAAWRDWTGVSVGISREGKAKMFHVKHFRFPFPGEGFQPIPVKFFTVAAGGAFMPRVKPTDRAIDPSLRTPLNLPPCAGPPPWYFARPLTPPHPPAK